MDIDLCIFVYPKASSGEYFALNKNQSKNARQLAIIEYANRFFLIGNDITSLSIEIQLQNEHFYIIFYIILIINRRLLLLK